MAACLAGQMILFVCSILWDLGVPQAAATLLYEDNNACIAMANAQKPTQQTWHMDIMGGARSHPSVLNRHHVEYGGSIHKTTWIHFVSPTSWLHHGSCSTTVHQTLQNTTRNNIYPKFNNIHTSFDICTNSRPNGQDSCKSMPHVVSNNTPPHSYFF